MLAVCVYAVALPLGLASGDYDLIARLHRGPGAHPDHAADHPPVQANEEPWVRRLIAAALYLSSSARGSATTSPSACSAWATPALYHISGAAIGKEFRGFNFGGQAYQDEIPKLVGTPSSGS